VDALCYQGADEAQHQHGRGCYGDQVNGPWVAASADKIEMSGATFVSISVKAHGGVPFCKVAHLEEIPDGPRINKRPIGLHDTTFSDRGENA
jgi:hypothetical protein